MNRSHQVRLAGTAYAIGGLLWLVLMLVLASVFGGDPSGDSAAFVPSQLLYIVLQVLLLFGFFGIWWSGGVGRSLFAMIAFGLGLLGHLIFVVGEAYSLLIGAVSDLVALAALVSAMGMLLTGIAILTAKQWHGWARWMPLVAGLYPWLFMFPVLAISGEPNLFVIAGWGLLRLFLGLAIRTQADALPATAPRNDVPLQQRHI